MSHRFTIIIFKGEKHYISKCLELGVTSQGKNIEEAKKNLKEAIELYLENEDIKISKEEPILSFIDVSYA